MIHVQVLYPQFSKNTVVKYDNDRWNDVNLIGDFDSFFLD
jgi:hypothetical protein